MTVSPDSTLLATAVDSESGSRFSKMTLLPVRLYDMPKGTRATDQLGGWPEGATVRDAVVFSLDGRRIAAGIRIQHNADLSPTGIVSVWDLAHRDEPAFTVQLPNVEQVALSPDGQTVFTVAGGRRTVRAYDVDSGELLRWASPALLAEGEVQAVDISPDGDTLAIATSSHIVPLNTQTLRLRGQVLAGHSDAITDLDYSHDGTLLMSVSLDGVVLVRDAATGSERQRMSPGTGSSAAAFGADDSTVVTGTEKLMTWDLSGTHELYSRSGSAADTRARLALAAAAPDGQTVARQRLGHLWFVDDRTGKATTPVEVPVGTNFHAFSPDGRWFLAICGDQVMRVWDTRTGRLIAERPDVRERWTAAFASGSDLIYLSDNYDGLVRPLHRTTLEQAGTAIRAGFDVTAVLPDRATGTVLALTDQWVGRFDPAHQRELVPPTLARLTTDRVIPALSPDGTRLMGLDTARRVRLMDLATGEWLTPATRADWAPEYTFAYSPDGSQVASAGPDRIRIWDGHTGAYQGSLPLPERAPDSSIAYLPDSSGLLVTTLEGSSWTVPTRPSAWVERACAIAGRELTQSEWDQFFPGHPYRAVCSQ